MRAAQQSLARRVRFSLLHPASQGHRRTYTDTQEGRIAPCICGSKSSPIIEKHCPPTEAKAQPLAQHAPGGWGSPVPTVTAPPRLALFLKGHRSSSSYKGQDHGVGQENHICPKGLKSSCRPSTKIYNSCPPHSTKGLLWENSQEGNGDMTLVWMCVSAPAW